MAEFREVDAGRLSRGDNRNVFGVLCLLLEGLTNR